MKTREKGFFVTLTNPPLTEHTIAIRRKPLMLHVSVAAGSLARPHLNHGAQFGNDFWSGEESSHLKSDMKKVIEGLAAYQKFAWERPATSAPVVFTDGSLRVTHHAAKGKAKAGIIIIPSLINGNEILDLLPERSLVEFLCHHECDVFMIDWGNLRTDSDYSSFQKFLGEKLHRAVMKISHDHHKPLFAMGYCMGGLLLAGYEALHPNQFRGHIYVATPWDFSQKNPDDFGVIIHNWAREGLAKLACLDYMPMEWLQMMFAAVDPDLIARKYAAFAAMDPQSAEARLFVAVEDWVNGGQDLPAPLLFQAIKNWYVENNPTQGKWFLGKQKVQLKNFTTPSFVIVPQRDKIVPSFSARALYENLKNAEILEPDCGHISMMIGRKAKHDVWQPLQDWIMRQCNTQNTTTS